MRMEKMNIAMVSYEKKYRESMECVEVEERNNGYQIRETRAFNLCVRSSYDNFVVYHINNTSSVQ